jgi:hypothetical protein
MGYTSQVGLAIQCESLSQLVESEHADKIKTVLGWADLHLKNNEGAHLFMWDCIKWYDSSEPIATFIKTLRSLDDQFSFLLLELGESANDVFEIGGWYSNDFSLGMRRQLLYDACAGEEIG